ncbi:MAG: 3-phosphoshikimate 1-carboxyvinyltransferase, partial [Firmicutes bacterium]|nr:3-phosphoshikimate 1-carboxyvinyltransferase [Bacillota bacterium]
MKLKGQITVPGDKSISHRALLISSVSKGTSLLEGLNRGLDCQETMNCLRMLGVGIKRKNQLWEVKGRNFRLKPPGRALNCGDSATTLRLLAGLLAGQEFASVLDGNRALRSRPMARIIGPLRLMGADLFGAEGSNLEPISVRGGRLKGITYELPMASAQVKSALLLAGIQAEGKTTVLEPVASRNHTEKMLAFAGADITCLPGQITVQSGAVLGARHYRIPGDLSSAAFFMGAAAVLPGSELIVK